ncbi:unnamed protein product [Symbiodinium necroappetens]|uniref:Uncharacterized protein n=1 Tax=Symbiodinium necroappetens TaxID=1628268 RepID=A0A812SMF3_9DINO|nr:unnamed protein product [Symbiodinium necroappetens]
MDLAMRVVWLAVLLSSLPVLAMQRGSGYGKGSQGGKPRYWGTGPSNMDILIEEVRGSPSSPSESPQAKRKSKKAKVKKEKRRREENSRAVSPGLDSAEKKELQDFRRQAELEKLRAEIRASLEGSAPPEKLPQKEAPSTPKPGRSSSTKDVLTPKTSRLVGAEARLFQDGGVKQLVGNSCSSWQQVSEELATHSLPDIKCLLKQLRPDENIPRSKAEVA